MSPDRPQDADCRRVDCICCPPMGLSVGDHRFPRLCSGREAERGSDPIRLASSQRFGSFASGVLFTATRQTYPAQTLMRRLGLLHSGRGGGTARVRGKMSEYSRTTTSAIEQLWYRNSATVPGPQKPCDRWPGVWPGGPGIYSLRAYDPFVRRLIARLPRSQQELGQVGSSGKSPITPTARSNYEVNRNHGAIFRAAVVRSTNSSRSKL